MAGTKLSALTELTTTPASDDEVYIRDVSEEAYAESKKITIANLLGGAVLKSTYNANTILAATSDNTPAAITVAEQTVVGRITSGAIKALSVAELQTLILSAALPENVSITLDAALSADGKYCGVTETGTAGTALSFGHVVYFSSTDNKWEKAKGDAETTVKGKVGICVKAAAENASTIILLWGKVRADAIFPTLTVGSPVFISWDTAGLLTQGTPTTGKIMRCIGHPNSGDELYFCPDNVYVEAA